MSSVHVAIGIRDPLTALEQSGFLHGSPGEPLEPLETMTTHRTARGELWQRHELLHIPKVLDKLGILAPVVGSAPAIFVPGLGYDGLIDAGYDGNECCIVAVGPDASAVAALDLYD